MGVNFISFPPHHNAAFTATNYVCFSFFFHQLNCKYKISINFYLSVKSDALVVSRLYNRGVTSNWASKCSEDDMQHMPPLLMRCIVIWRILIHTRQLKWGSRMSLSRFSSRSSGSLRHQGIVQQLHLHVEDGKRLLNLSCTLNQLYVFPLGLDAYVFSQVWRISKTF